MLKKAILGLLFATFVLQIQADVVLSDSFAYADGSVTAVSGGKWANHSGTAGQVDVAAGKLNVTEKEAEDVNAILSGGPFTPAGGTNLYAGFTANFSALPSGTGTYFAHFKDATPSGFSCRVFATTSGAAAGKFRLGIAHRGGTAVITNSVDLSLGTNYRVVAKLSIADGASTLWVDPTTEATGGVTATDTNAVLTITSFAFRQSLSSGVGMGVMTVDDLVVATTFTEAKNPPGFQPPVAPSFVLQPGGGAYNSGDTVNFPISFTGSAPLYFTWFFNNGAIPGATNATFSLFNVQPTNAGNYFVIITNTAGGATSQVATITVSPPASQVVTNISYVRAQVDRLNNTNNVNTATNYTVEGIVTTFVNLTGGANVLFYMQDDSAGIAVFWTGGTNQFIPAAGDKVRVTAPLSFFNGLLELGPNVSVASTSVKLISTNNPLPAATPIQFAWQSDFQTIELNEGRYVVVSNVTVDVSTSANFPANGATIKMTNEFGETFDLRLDARIADIIGQPKPTTPITIKGVLGQFDSSNPRDSGYQLLVTRFADLIGGTKAPVVAFTNRLNLIRAGDSPTNKFTEFAILPGERIIIDANISDPSGKVVTLTAPSAGLPAGAAWTTSGGSGTNLTARFAFTASIANSGQSITPTLKAANDVATNTATWSIYVPTIAEQKVAITEFMPNAVTAATNAFFNPLGRATPGTDPSWMDEYVELANVGGVDVDLLGWSIADSSDTRHRFYDTFILGSSNSVVVYGGPLNGNAVGFSTPSIPASENKFGFGLNNTGGDSVILRNADGKLISRIVYTDALSSPGNSATRYPDINSPFVLSTTVSGTNATPGLQYNGQPFSVPPTYPSGVATLSAAIVAGVPTLSWQADTSRTYTIYSTDDLKVKFTPLVSGFKPSVSTGSFSDSSATNAVTRYYFITVP